MGDVIVYALIDPRSLLIRYVGVTARIVHRFSEHDHLDGRNPHKDNWIRELSRAGVQYDIAILETRQTYEELLSAERWWIAYGRLSGWPLTNMTEGGQGWNGRKHTDEARAKLSVALKGNTNGVGNKGRATSEEWRLKMSRAKFGNNNADGPHRCGVCKKKVYGHNARTCPERSA